MATITLNFKTDQTQRAIDRLATQAPIAIVRALNKSIASAKTAMNRVVSQDMGLKVSDVSAKIGIVPAAADRQRARLYADATRIPLIKFGAKGPEPSRGKGRGVTAKLGQARGRYPTAFIATMAGGHRGVYVRNAKARLSIRELFGPSIAHVFEKHVNVGIARGQEQLAKNLKSEFRFALQQAA
jgi:hypothetical protein